MMWGRREGKLPAKAINRGIKSLRCAARNCPPDVRKPCWLRGQFRCNRAVGVDVVGYLLSEIGLGEAARLLVGALDTAGIPTGLINLPLPGRMSDATLADRLARSQSHAVALSIGGASELLSFARRTCRGQMNIAYPFWELPTFPAEWRGVFDGFDAYWAPTSFVRDALVSFQDRPVHLVPQPVRLPDEAPVPRPVAGPLRIYTFFDFDSYMTRKNPLGAIRAFRAAFPTGREDVTLLVKARGTPSEQGRRELFDLALPDPRIEIQDRLLDRSEMTALMDACDVFISLHRSEGFGLGCAEALARGKGVVTTDFGGTRDFINERTGFPVAFTPVPLRSDDYLGAEGAYWAEPSIEHAASILRAIYDHPACLEARVAAGYTHLRRHHSFSAVGTEIRRLLAMRTHAGG